MYPLIILHRVLKTLTALLGKVQEVVNHRGKVIPSKPSSFITLSVLLLLYTHFCEDHKGSYLA